MANLYQRKRILLVAATVLEMRSLLPDIHILTGEILDVPGFPDVQALLTGVGVLPTTYYLSRTLLEKEYDLIINIGLCGSFSSPPRPGELVLVTEDRLYGLGAEGKEGFLNLRDIGLSKSGEPEDGFYYTPESIIPQSLKDLRRVKGITVNTIHAWSESIQSVLAHTGASVESMEGAACMFCAAKHGIDVMQIRAVSNKVGPRDISSWDIEGSLKTLHTTLRKILKELR